MFLIECILFFSTIILLIFTFIRGGGHYFSLISLYCYLFSMMYLFRHGILLFGLDVPMPDEYFYFNSDSTRLYTLFCVFLWSIGFYLSLSVSLNNERLTKVISTLFPKHPIDVKNNKLIIANLILLGLTFIITMSLVTRFGFDVSKISYAVRMDKYFSGMSFLINVNVFAAYLLATTAFKFYLDSQKRLRDIQLFILLSMIAFLAISPSFLMADRDNVVFFIVYYFAGLCLYISSRFKLLILPFATLSIWIIVLMQKIRLANWGYDKEYSSVFRQLSSGLNHQFYDSFILLVKGIEENWFFGQGYRYGEDFLLGLIGIIPRSLWEGKPEMVDPGIWFSNQFITGATYGWPISNIGEWWFNFSILGVLIGGAFSGLLYKSISYRYRNYEVQPLSWFVLFFIATRILPLGYSTSTPMYLILNLVPLYLLFLFVGKVINVKS